MDSFEFNKLIGGLLAVIFGVFSVGIVSDALFASPVPEKPGYHIEAVEEEGHGGATEGGADEQQPIAVLLASANVEAGQASFKKCAACHTAENGGANKVGPNLWNIVNRPIAGHPGFAYSAAMKAFAETAKVWDYDHLDQFLLTPKGTVKGTAMGFAGLKKPDERANVIAYLRSLSDAPVPLPAAPAPAAENASAPGGTEAAPPALGGTEAAQPAPGGTEAAQPAPGGTEAAQPAPGGTEAQPAPGGTEAPASPPDATPAAPGATENAAPNTLQTAPGGTEAPASPPDATQPAPGATENAAPNTGQTAPGGTAAPQPAQ